MAGLPTLPLPPIPPWFGPAPGNGNGFPAVGAAVFLDDGAPPTAAEVWGSVDCAKRSRLSDVHVGGDPEAGADGRPQDAGFRRLRVVDGDNVAGERCELGRNDHRTSPVSLYQEGSRRITFLSLRLADDFPLDRKAWQVVMQMKQTQPADSGGGVPVLALQANRNRWRLVHSDYDVGVIWAAPASRGRWVRFAFDVTYSTDPEVGSVRVSADLDADGDALDKGERSDRVALRTLKVEGPGSDSDGLAQGDPIPSHLRVGIYHSPVYPCRGRSCSIGVDNVGVYEPPAGQ